MDSFAKSHQRKLVDGFKLCAIPPTEVGGRIQARNPLNGSWVDGFKRAIPSQEVGWMDSSAQSPQRKLVDGFKRDLHEGLVCSNPLNGSWGIIHFLPVA